MSTPKENKDPDSVPDIEDDGSRPWVDPYLTKPTFYVWDEVYLLNANGSREGPYFIATLPSPTKCTLCFENGVPAKGGSEIDIDLIEAP